MAPEGRNNVKGLEAKSFVKAFIFRKLIAFSRRYILEFLRYPARPIHNDAFRLIACAHSERSRQLGLRQIARTALDDSHLHFASVEDANGRANRVAVRFCSRQIESQRAVARALIIAIQKGSAVVCRQQKVQITVAVEISKCKSAPNFRARKVAPCFSGRFAEFSSTLIDEKLRWLRVTNIATDVPHGFIYMAVRNCKIGSAIQIDV